MILSLREPWAWRLLPRKGPGGHGRLPAPGSGQKRRHGRHPRSREDGCPQNPRVFNRNVFGSCHRCLARQKISKQRAARMQKLAMRSAGPQTRLRQEPSKLSRSCSPSLRIANTSPCAWPHMFSRPRSLLPNRALETFARAPFHTSCSTAALGHCCSDVGNMRRWGNPE